AVEAQVDSNAAGVAEAFQYTAVASGTVTQLNVYLDASGAAKSVVVGLYSTDASNNPGTLLTQATIAAPVKGSWNAVAVSGATVTSGTKYWIAILGPNGAGAVKFRDVASGGRSRVSAQTNLTTLPATWSSGTLFSSAPMSAYARP